MSDTVINVENVSKRYIIGHEASKGDGLRHAIEGVFRSPLRWLRSVKENRQATKEEFWALRGVNMEVKRGEVTGIIGRNGAGKSTLLKVLSRITDPTEGRIRLRGTVASLLEVGTGFHPELTGRENIFLNGAILGMPRTEIRRKFDEIVAFSDIEKFIDTPVKRYSSGMYVRLAFAVAAHLEPDILIVDEVLAVGDAAFQKKCLGKMDEVAKTGRTVLFVSHNMPLIANLCTTATMLRGGRVAATGEVRSVIDRYLADVAGLGSKPLAERTDRSGNGEIMVTDLEVLDRSGKPAANVISGETVTIRLHYVCRDHGRKECRAGVMVRESEQLCCVLSTWMARPEPIYVSGSGHIDFTVRDLPLAGGVYTLDPFLESNELYDNVSNGGEMSVVDGDFFGSGRIKPSPHWRSVGVLVRHECHGFG
ncbi:MAG TPA: ABC transporter ATP-binding protein [Opitutaceae bacterium]